MTKETVEFVAHNYSFDEPKLKIHEREHLTLEARMALAFIEKWAMVAGEADGEDSSGRSKLRRMTPKEIVAHAVETADRAIQAFNDHGWIKMQPSLLDVLKDAEAAKANAPKDGKNASGFCKIY